ncbi:DUF2029 domain-containing protein [Vibrio fluvialis]|nr:DUF2029 domain-containing protein [Vibrio fluvialis]
MERNLSIEQQYKKIKFVYFFIGIYGLYFLFLDNFDFINGGLSRGQVVGRDFLQFWTAASLAVNDRYNDIYDFFVFTSHAPEQVKESGVTFNFLYPPHALALILPIGKLNYIPALALWTVSCLAIYLIVAKFSLRNFDRFWFALILAPATIQNISFGQSGLFSSALLVGGLICLKRYPKIAGILFGILTFKPHMGLLIPIALIAGSYWKTLLWASISTLSFLGLSIYILDVTIWLSWFENEPWVYAKHWIEHGVGLGIFMQPSPFTSFRLLFGSLSVAWASQFIFSVLAAICVGLVFKKSKDEELKYSVLIIATYLASPYVHSYDLAALSVVVIWLLQRGIKFGFERGEKLILLLAWFLPFLIILLSYDGLPLSPFFLLYFLIYVCRKALLDNSLKLDGKTIG